MLCRILEVDHPRGDSIEKAFLTTFSITRLWEFAGVKRIRRRFLSSCAFSTGSSGGPSIGTVPLVHRAETNDAFPGNQRKHAPHEIGGIGRSGFLRLPLDVFEHLCEARLAGTQ